MEIIRLKELTRFLFSTMRVTSIYIFTILPDGSFSHERNSLCQHINLFAFDCSIRYQANPTFLYLRNPIVQCLVFVQYLQYLTKVVVL